MSNKKKILIIAETGISAELFKERFERLIASSGSCATVELVSLNEFNKGIEEFEPTHILLAPNAYVLEEHVAEYLRRLNKDARIVRLPNEDYASMNVERILIDEL